MAIAEQEQFDIVIELAVDIIQQVKCIERAKYRSKQVADTITHKLELITQLMALLKQELVFRVVQVETVRCIKFILAEKLIKQSDMMADLLVIMDLL
jgi:hypothetical protein